MNKFYSLLLIAGLLFSTTYSQAQVLDVLKKTSKKLGKSLENIAEDFAAEVLNREITNSVDDWADQQLKDMYAQDSINNTQGSADSLGNRVSRDYSSFLDQMNEDVDLPEKYVFDFTMVVETSSKGEKSDQIELMYSKTNKAYGFRQQDEDEKTLFVYDGDLDASVVYMEDGKGKRTKQVIANISAFAGLVKVNMEDEKYSIEKTGGRDIIAGYMSDEYVGNSEDEKFELYTTTELGINTYDMYKGMIEQFLPASSQNDLSKIKGIMMKSISYDRQSGEVESSWEVLEVNEEPFTIQNADW